MSEAFADYLSKYLREHATELNQYLLTALNSKDHTISYLESSAGADNQSRDLKNCEFLAGAHLFKETLRISRNGRNFYKCFELTDLGLKFAENLQQNGGIVANPL
jgi:hypothetical protein